MKSGRALAAASLLMFALACAAGEPAKDGVALESEAQPPWQSFVVRRTGGAPDARFGVNGRVLIDAMAPRSVAADSRGRYMVAGQARGTTPRPAVQRLLSNGQTDTTWGDQGLASDLPVAMSSTAVEAMPLGDGRTLVLGEVEALNAQAALWIVGTDGKFEKRWLLMSEARSSRVLSLVPVNSEAAMIGLRVGRDSGVALEVYLFVAARDGDAVPERVGSQPVPVGWQGAVPVLERRAAGGWFWIDREAPKRPAFRVVGTDQAELPLWTWQQAMASVPAVQPAPAVTDARESGAAAFNPFVERRSTDTPTPERSAAVDPSGSELAVWGMALLAGGLALLRFLRRRI